MLPASSTEALFVCDPAWQPHLIEEIRRTSPDVDIREPVPGWLLCRDIEPTPIAFAYQVLPHAEPLATPSISKAAAQASEILIERLADHDGPWRLHIFTPEIAESTASPKRCSLIEEGIDKHLAKKQRRLRRTRVDDHNESWQPDEWLIQLGLMTAEHGWLSIARPEDRLGWGTTLSRFAGGMVNITHDTTAPSRAHGKIVETEKHLGLRIEQGETCVDLGASPGGWTYHAMKHGARVLAVDRSPLREDLMRDPHVEFVRGDAFRYEPPCPVEWLLCDVIAFPDKTLALLDEWLARRWCRKFIVTVKFRRDEHYVMLDDFKRLLAKQCRQWHLRRLRYNKNEVTAMGVCRLDPA